MREIKFRAWNECEKIMEYDIHLEYDRECSCFGDFLNNNFYSVMQYTGLKDVNDVEIYEGDIFHLGDKNIKYVVEYVDCGLKGKQLGTNSYIGLTYWKDKIEIIGNIYENPELLEDKRY